jgi:ATP-dependent RNA helicase DDX60
MYTISEDTPVIFAGLDIHNSTQRSRFIHPISALSFGARGLPADLALESADTLTLYQALTACKADLSNIDISAVDPVLFFMDRQRLLTQLDVINYEISLKAILEEIMTYTSIDTNSSPLHKVIRILEDPMLSKITTNQLNTIPSKNAFKSMFSVTNL